MKRYLLLLDFDGTLIERGSKGSHDKIPFHELLKVSEIYKQEFGIQIDYKILTSSCAKSIEDIMTVSEMSSIGEWLFEHGLHVRRYSDFYDKLLNNDDIESFISIKTLITSWLDRLHDLQLNDVILSLSDKKASIAVHLKHSQNEVFQALVDNFGARCTIIKSGLHTIEIFPKGYDKSWVLNHLDLSAYDSVVFI